MKTAAIYARVSSDKQREENTIASQTAALVTFAREQQFDVPQEWVFEDDGYITEPPVFLALRDLIDAITQWHRAPVNTARVLDGFRNLIAPGEEPKKLAQAASTPKGRRELFAVCHEYVSGSATWRSDPHFRGGHERCLC